MSKEHGVLPCHTGKIFCGHFHDYLKAATFVLPTAIHIYENGGKRGNCVRGASKCVLVLIVVYEIIQVVLADLSQSVNLCRSSPASCQIHIIGYYVDQNLRVPTYLRIESRSFNHFPSLKSS